MLGACCVTGRSVKFSQSHPAPSDTKFEEVPAEACGGVMKPDIIFFGQPLGNTVAAALNADRKKADCLLVMGTSMQVWYASCKGLVS